MSPTAEVSQPRETPLTGLSRPAAAWLMAAYLGVVALIVFWPTGEVASGSVRAIWSLTQVLGAPASLTPSDIEFGTNVLLFVPLSFLGHTFRPSWGWGAWLIAGLACSDVIELAQAVFLSGRSASLMDLTANTLGAVLGYAAVLAIRRTR